MSGYRKYDWGTVDWNRHTKEIAKDLGANPTLVSLMRKKLAPDTLGMYQEKRGKFDWASVDWSRSTREIAEELETPQSYVSFMRRKMANDTLALTRVTEARSRRERRWEMLHRHQIENGEIDWV